jgi:putative Mn2+ efflux pump MntP
MLALLFLSLALAADGFAVCLCLGSQKQSWAFRTSLVFALFHAGQLALGYWVGHLLASWNDYTPWIASGILALLGLKMLINSQVSLATSSYPDRPLGPVWALSGLLMAALATSVDCLAAGISLPLMRLDILWASLVLGLMTFMACWTGFRIGGLLGQQWGQKAEMLGGIILILLALKTLLIP